MKKLAYQDSYDYNPPTTNFNYNTNYNVDPYRDRLLERIETISRGNTNLVDYGYHSSIKETSSGEANAKAINDLVYKQGRAPHHESSMNKALLGGLVTGGAVGVGTFAGLNRLRTNPILSHLGAVGLGVGTGAIAGRKLYNYIYDEKKRKEDEEAQVNAHNKLLEHLASKGYRKLD